MPRTLFALMSVIVTVGLSIPTAHAANESPMINDDATFSPKCGGQVTFKRENGSIAITNGHCL